MDVSIFLARALGIYFVVLCLAMLTKRKFFHEVLQSVAGSKAVLYLSGLFSLIIGLLIVLSHNIWDCNWRIIVTVVGWLALVKGVLLIIAPKTFMSWSMKAFRVITPIVCAIIILVGAYLIYIGFFIA